MSDWPDPLDGDEVAGDDHPRDAGPVGDGDPSGAVDDGFSVGGGDEDLVGGGDEELEGGGDDTGGEDAVVGEDVIVAAGVATEGESGLVSVEPVVPDVGGGDVGWWAEGVTVVGELLEPWPTAGGFDDDAFSSPWTSELDLEPVPGFADAELLGVAEPPPVRE